METLGARGVTQLLLAWSGGERTALDELVALVYRDLRRMAASHMRRERAGHTLQPTALIHETYLRLVDQSMVECRSRAQFFAIAANLMRQILVNYAGQRNAAKRGGGNKVALEEDAAFAGEPEVDILALDQALTRLAALDPRQALIVELRYFGGLTEEEIASALGVSARTVKREWRTAKAVLHSELRHGGLS